MTEQDKIDQFNRDVDDVLKGNAPQAGTDPQRLDAARQLAAADFSARSRARATTRARLLARAIRELPIQNKRKEMNTRFSNVFRTLAFGAFLLMMVFGLGWVLSNTTPQLGVGLDVTPTVVPRGGIIVDIPFPRQPADWGSMAALMNGRLVLVDGCLRMEDAFSDTSSLVIWPHDYDWQITEGIVEVLDGAGQVVARVGEEIWLGGGEADSLNGLGGDDLMLAQIPEACLGPYWLSGGIAQLVTPAPIPEGAITDFPLTLASDSETIRQRLLISYQFWQALWADAQITDYVSGTPAVQRVQVWVNQPAQARVVSGKADGTPATLWISDGQMTRTGEDLSGYGLANFIPPMTESDTVEPHPMTRIMPTPLSSLLFPSGLAQRGGTYRPIALETLAGRETLVVEWNRPDGPLVDRFWVDTATGVILRQQNYGKGGDGALTYEYLLSNIQFDLTFHPETFNRLAAFPPAFAMGPEDIFTEVATPAPEGEPDTSLASGEIYLVLEKSYGTEPLGFWRFPANCLVSGKPCPPLESVPGAPQEFVIQHTWSPDGAQMIYKLIYPAGQNWRFDRLTQTWSLLDIPYLWGEIWSPDSQWLLGVPAGQPENYPLVLTRADGTEWQTLMDGTSEIKTPIAWLDDHRILMTTTLDNETSEESPTLAEDLQIYDLQTGEIQTLLSKVWNPDTTFYGAFALSPDRTKVVYAIADLNGQNSEIRILTLADNTEFSFTFPSPVGPSWSPTGEWLSLTSGDGYSCQIHLIRPDGSEPHPVFTGDWGGGCQHIWSPDGQYLLVPALAQTPTIPRLYVITVATGESRLVELPDVGVEFEWPVVSWVP